MQRRSWRSLRGLEGPAGPGARSWRCPGTATPVPCCSRCFPGYGHHIPLPKHPSRSCRAGGVCWFCQGWDHPFQGFQGLLPWHVSILLSRGSSEIWEARLLHGMLGRCWGHHSCSGLESQHTQHWHPDPTLLADPNARIRSSSTPAPALIPDNLECLLLGSPNRLGVPGEGSRAGRAFLSLTLHYCC